MPKRKAEEGASIDDELLALYKPSAKKKRKQKGSEEQEGLYDDEEEDMNFSSSEEELEEEFDEDLHKKDDLDADLRWLNSLSEVRREAEYTQRYEKRKALKERREQKEKLKNEIRRKRRKEAELRRSSREVPAGHKSGSAKELQKLKEKRQRQKQRKAEEDEREDVPEPEIGEEADEDYSLDEGEAGEGEQGDAREVETAEDEGPMELAHARGSTLGRRALSKLLKEPYFDEIVEGFFVRVALDSNPHVDRSYRMARIRGVRERSKHYTVDDKQRTGKYLVLVIGKAQKEYPVWGISNSPITQPEFLAYCKKLEKDGVRVPTIAERNTVREKLKIVSTFVYDAQTVKKMVEDKKKLQKTPANIATRIIALRKARAAAESDRNEEKLSSIEKELATLERIAETRHKQHVEARKANAIADKLNERNRSQNIQISTTTPVRSSEKPYIKRRETRPVGIQTILAERAAKEEAKAREETERDVKMEDANSQALDEVAKDKNGMDDDDEDYDVVASKLGNNLAALKAREYTMEVGAFFHDVHNFDAKVNLQLLDEKPKKLPVPKSTLSSFL